MNTFTAGQKVRVTEEYAKSNIDTDGSLEAVVGKVGIVRTDANPAESEYVTVQLPHTEWYWLFFPEELEAV
jgi:hypothetical protein